MHSQSFIAIVKIRHVCVQIRWREVPGSAWGAVLWAALGTSFLAHSGIAFAVSRCAAVVPSIYSCLQVCSPLPTHELRAGLCLCACGGTSYMLRPDECACSRVAEFEPCRNLKGNWYDSSAKVKGDSCRITVVKIKPLIDRWLLPSHDLHYCGTCWFNSSLSLFVLAYTLLTVR